MSYEGYEQHICEKGHRFDREASYMMDDAEVRCSCGAPSVWVNLVDDTNCDETGVIPSADWEQFKLTDDEVKTCDLGHQHVVREATFRVPSDDERDQLRSYRDDKAGKYVRLSSFPEG